MLFLQNIMINFVLTKSSGPKSHAVSPTVPIFAGFCDDDDNLFIGFSAHINIILLHLPLVTI